MNHTQHAFTKEHHRKLSKRADSALDFLIAIAIGVGLALLITAWWSA